jgi:hypothetical protein
MNEDSRKVIELLPKYVFFSPMDDGSVALMLPILPAGIVYNDAGYKAFVHAFDNVIIDYDDSNENSDLIGVVFIYHQSVVYKFSALLPFLDACITVGKATLTPYCPEDGFPKQDIYGGEVPVVLRITTVMQS